MIPDGIFRKAFRSSFEGNCVEVASDGKTVWVRDSKDPAGAVLEFNLREWLGFTGGVRRGEFDLT